MAHRRRTKKRSDRKRFSRTAGAHRKNFKGTPMRGGTRL
ncbi:MAG: hypothetical protein [Microvirus sp.]|nr:MAG: hypothetical protein [Microvirus sp.]